MSVGTAGLGGASTGDGAGRRSSTVANFYSPPRASAATEFANTFRAAIAMISTQVSIGIAVLSSTIW
jgi:hypothetical protein